MYKHIRLIHERNFLCETCGKSFACSDVFKKHKCFLNKKVKTRNNLDIIENIVAIDEDAKDGTTASALKGLFNTKTWRIRNASDHLV